MSSNIILSWSSFVSKTKFLSANVVGTIPSISNPAFLNIDVNFLTYSLWAKIITILSNTISTKACDSGTSMSFI